MRPNMTKSRLKKQLQTYNKARILSSSFHPLPINLKLITNPFLKDQQKFHYLTYRLSDYNRRVSADLLSDPYQSTSFHKLHSILSDISYLQTKEDQIARLEEAFKWWKEQERLIEQRKDQGYVRYEVTKNVRYGISPQRGEPESSQHTEKNQIPHKKLARQSKPFKRGWRTTHKELDLPIKRLNEYKRKVINIAPFIEQKDERKAPRIIYPKIQKIQEPKEEEEEKIQQNEEENKEVEKIQEKQEQADLGGFGEQPEQPQEEEEKEEEGDKLAPRFKNYVVEFNDIKRKSYQGPYLFYRGEECKSERKMEDRYLKGEEETGKKQKQDSLYISFVTSRGENKGKIQKSFQKRIENMKVVPKYSISQQIVGQSEKLRAEQEIKYGFTMGLGLKEKKKEQIDFSSLALPQISQKGPLFEKSIRNNRMKTLKNKFSKMLNLKEYEEREATPSLCQYSSRKRGISDLIKSHTKSKERLHQLDQVTTIKQKLAQNKANIDIRSLSMGLCSPGQQNYEVENIYPQKDLPSNPIMAAETKKKKKKK